MTTKQSGKKSKGVKAWGLKQYGTGIIVPIGLNNKRQLIEKELFPGYKVIRVLITSLPRKVKNI